MVREPYTAKLPASLRGLSEAEAGTGPRGWRGSGRVWKQRGRSPIGRSLPRTAGGGRCQERGS